MSAKPVRRFLSWGLELAQDALETFLAMPLLMQVGLAIFGVAGAVDLTYHSSPLVWQHVMETYVGADAIRVHLSIFAGMVLTWLGALSMAFRQSSVHRDAWTRREKQAET